MRKVIFGRGLTLQRTALPLQFDNGPAKGKKSAYSLANEEVGVATLVAGIGMSAYFAGCEEVKRVI